MSEQSLTLPPGEGEGGDGAVDPPSPLEAALALLAEGRAVIPLVPGTKRTWLKTWAEFQTRRPTEAEVRRWWGRSPSSGVAVVCGAISGLVVVDIDPRNDGEAGWAQLVATHGAPPATRRTVSGRGDGGRHYWFAHPGGVVATIDLAPGVQRLGDGHLLVVPPSLHPVTGQPYRWDDGGEPAPAPTPAWVLEAMPAESPASTSSSSAPRGGGRRRVDVDPMSPAQQAEFARLWSSLGVELVDGDHHYHCPLHAGDDTESLHVDAAGGRWYCFGCSAGGGLRTLRERVEPRPVGGQRVRSGVPPARGGGPAESQPAPGPGVNFSSTEGGQGHSQEKFTPPGITGAIECGAVTWLTRTGADRWVRVPCKRKGCVGCGPVVRQAAGDHYGEQLAGAGEAIYQVRISRAGWKAMVKRLTRAGARYVRVPAPGGAFVVLSTLVLGEAVADPKTAAQEACRAMPTDSAHVSSSRPWAMTSKPAGPDVGDGAERWELVGVLGVSVAEARAAAAAEGVELRSVPAEALGPDVAEGWDLAGLDDVRRRRLMMRVHLIPPGQQRQSRGLRPAVARGA